MLILSLIFKSLKGLQRRRPIGPPERTAADVSHRGLTMQLGPCR